MTAILVVEDEPIIREVTATLLGHYGFSPHTAATPEDALVLVDRVPIDIILADVVIPGHADGYTMVEHLRSSGWAGRIIFTSGDPDAIEQARRIDGDAPFLPKPYDRRMLLGAIEQVRDPGTAGARPLRAERDMLARGGNRSGSGAGGTGPGFSSV